MTTQLPDDNPQNEYGNVPEISVSPHRQIYEDLDNSLLDSYTPNRPLYKKCISSNQLCQLNTFCEFEKMKPTQEQMLMRPQPYSFGVSMYSKQFNERHSNLDFPSRNMAIKQKAIRTVATEESLDDWQAQSLGLTYEKLVKFKKFI